jgi:hypothetical protein
MVCLRAGWVYDKWARAPSDVFPCLLRRRAAWYRRFLYYYWISSMALRNTTPTLRSFTFFVFFFVVLSLSFGFGLLVVILSPGRRHNFVKRAPEGEVFDRGVREGLGADTSWLCKECTRDHRQARHTRCSYT